MRTLLIMPFILWATQVLPEVVIMDCNGDSYRYTNGWLSKPKIEKNVNKIWVNACSGEGQINGRIGTCEYKVIKPVTY